MTEQSQPQLVIEAYVLFKKIAIQKRLVTLEIKKVNGLITEYKAEKLAKSTLTRVAAEAATQGWQTAKDKMERLEEMMHQHNEMAWVACTEDMDTETTAQIDENCSVLEDY